MNRPKCRVITGREDESTDGITDNNVDCLPFELGTSVAAHTDAGMLNESAINLGHVLCGIGFLLALRVLVHLDSKQLPPFSSYRCVPASIAKPGSVSHPPQHGGGVKRPPAARRMRIDDSFAAATIFGRS